MSVLPQRLRRWWASVGFRLAFFCGLLVAITMMATLAVVYLQTVVVMQQRLTRQVATSALRLQAIHEQGGQEALAGEIARILADGRDSDNEILLLTDAAGRPVAGNIEAPSARALPADGVSQQTQVLRVGQPVTAYLLVRSLPGGGRLWVGHDLQDQQGIESLVGRASLAAGIVALLLLVGGSVVFRHEFERSVGGVRRTAARIAEGHLRERVRSSGQDDEFALLEGDINTMLDRIESLMDGVRHVSDTIAHDLRTPLTRILMRLRAAEAAPAGDARQQEAIRRSIEDIEELTTVFEKLLRIAEAEAGTRRGQFAPVALHEIADDVVDLYEAVAEAAGVRLLRRGDLHAVAVGDRDLVAGAMANLVDNAIKHAGAGATVQVHVGPRDDGLSELRVQDDGPGIPADRLPQAGTRFFRLSHDRPGHGLGLASVRAVVALHGGRLVFEDAAPGLCVRVLLPAVPGR